MGNRSNGEKCFSRQRLGRFGAGTFGDMTLALGLGPHLVNGCRCKLQPDYARDLKGCTSNSGLSRSRGGGYLFLVNRVFPNH